MCWEGVQMTSKPGYSEEEIAALRRVQALIDQGRVALGRDPWRQGAPTLAHPDLVARWAARYSKPRTPFCRRLWLAVIG